MTTTIDCTPTWAGLLPVLLELRENSNNGQALQTAATELRRMAGVADLANELLKALTGVLPYVPGHADNDTAGRPWLEAANNALAKAKLLAAGGAS